MDRGDTFVLTDLPSETDPDGTVTGRTHRCNGCAGCITYRKGSCTLDDDFSKTIPQILDHDVLEIRTDVSDSKFEMPMRKAAERLGNVLQAFTEAGGNDPLRKDSVALREIHVVVSGEPDRDFEEYARDMLLMGPVESMTFDYLGNRN